MLTEVTLLGEDDSLVSVASIAAQCGTMSYECVAGINPLIVRKIAA